MKQISSLLIFLAMVSLHNPVLSQQKLSVNSITSSAFPLKLYNFSGNKSNNKIYLQWAISENEKAERFEIERSTNGKDFSLVALIFASENSGDETYKFFEAAPKRKVKYRLKMYDKNLGTRYSEVLNSKEIK
jgi:hypothetical protein